MKKVNISIIIASLLLLFTGISVYANGGPGEPSIYQGDGYLTFDENSMIRLESETIEMTISDDDYQNIFVEVNYNLIATDGDESIDMYFILPEVGEYEEITKNYTVYLNNEPITDKTRLTSIPKVTNWAPSTQVPLVNPITGDIYDEDYRLTSTMYENILGIIIPMDLNVGETTTLKVEYEGRSGFYDYGLRNPIMNYLYFITPAEFWLNDTDVSYTLTLPKEEKFEIYSTLDLEKQDNIYTGHITELPNHEWQIAYVDKSNLLFGINNLSLHNIIMVIYMIIIIITAIFLNKKYKTILIPIITYIICAAIIIFLTGPRAQTYGNGIMMFLKIALFGVIIPIVFVLIKLLQLLIRGATKQFNKDEISSNNKTNI